MDHEQAIQTDASMRYALGELTPAERDSFEEHYADCSHCMSDVELATAFAANAKDVFRDRALARDEPKRIEWLRWRPFPALVLSGALNLVLAGGVTYGILRLQPATLSGVAHSRGLPSAVAQPPGLESVDIVRVLGVRRGPGEPEQVVNASHRQLVLTFDLIVKRYEHYFYAIDRAGASVRSGEVSVPGRPDAVNLPIPLAQLEPGKYEVTVTGTIGGVTEPLGTCLIQVPTR